MQENKEKARIVQENLFLKKYSELNIREGFFSDSAGALGHLQSTMIACAQPQFIGRDIIPVQPTTQPSERWPIDSKAVAYTYAEGTATRTSGIKTQFINVSTNEYAEASEQWTQEYIEDYMTLNVVDWMINRLSRALAENETRAVLSLYDSVLDEDLAGGAPIDQEGKIMDWNAVLKLHNRLRGENIRPKVLVLNTTQLSQLLLDDKFVDINAISSRETDVNEGMINQILSMRVRGSSLVPNGTAYAIDPLIASIMLLRRDVTVEDWSDPKNDQYGIKATTRFGLGVLRSNVSQK
jgi:HK97 family phage major capsid protein